MTIIRRMVFREFVGIFLVALLSITGLFVIVDFFDRVQRYSGEWGAPVTLLFQYMLYKTPQIVYDMTPLTIPLSGLVTLGFLSRNRELAAIRAGGVSARSALAPVFIFALFCAVALFALGEYIAPKSNRRAGITYREIRRYRLSQVAAIDGSDSKAAMESFGGWYRGALGPYYIGRYFVQLNHIMDLTVLEMGPGFRLKRRVDSMEAAWENDRWVGSGVILRDFSPDGTITTMEYDKRELDIPEDPGDFKSIKVEPQEMGFFELKDYIERLESGGSDMSEFRVDLWAKASYPLAGFILLVLAVPLGLREGRGKSISMGIFLILAVCLSYYEFHAWMLSIGRGGMASPPVAAWTADALFSIIGGIAYSKSA